MAKSKKEDKLSMCMITQAYYPQHWSADKWDADVIKDAKLREITAKIAKYLVDEGAEVDAVYGITHDRDTREIWDDKLKQNIIEQKHIHGHWVVKFKDKESGLPLSKIAEAVGLAPQYIDKAKPGRFAYDNMLSYLIHAKDSEKFAYSASDVVSVVNRGVQTYQEIYAESKERWDKGRAKKTADKARSSETVESLYEKIVMGEVTKDEVLLTDEYYKIYCRNADKFDKGFKAYTERKIMQAIRDLEAGKFNVTVLYFKGETEAGKSKTAMRVASELVSKAWQRGEKWGICQAGATNALDDYNGEEILLMDDVRGTAMNASDWLKLLDPYNSSPNSARYKNKRVVSRYIFITSVQDVYDFFYDTKNASSERSEPLDQFIRRILALVHVISEDDVRVHPRVKHEHNKRIEKVIYKSNEEAYETLTLKNGFLTQGLKFNASNFNMLIDYLFDKDKRALMLERAQEEQDKLLQEVAEFNHKRSHFIDDETGEAEQLPWGVDEVSVEEYVEGDFREK